MATEAHRERAREFRETARRLGDLLHEKQIAYGNAQDRQAAMWRSLLKPYLTDDGEYCLPPALVVYHLPRLTRVFDRICRIVANPEGDAGGEDPYLDLAGDAIAGHLMPKPRRRTFDARGITFRATGFTDIERGTPTAVTPCSNCGMRPMSRLPDGANVAREWSCVTTACPFHGRWFGAAEWQARHTPTPDSLGTTHGAGVVDDDVAEGPPAAATMCGVLFREERRGVEACHRLAGHDGPHRDRHGNELAPSDTTRRMDADGVRGLVRLGD